MEKNKVIVFGFIVLIIAATFIYMSSQQNQGDNQQEQMMQEEAISEDNHDHAIHSEDYEHLAEHLYEYKSQYIGDNSNIIGLLDLLPYSEHRGDIQLFTSEKPYGLKAVYNVKTSDPAILDIRNQFYTNSLIVFSLVENVDYIDFELNVDGTTEPEIHRYERKEIETDINNLYGYSVDVETFEKFLEEKVYVIDCDCDH